MDDTTFREIVDMTNLDPFESVLAHSDGPVLKVAKVRYVAKR